MKTWLTKAAKTIIYLLAMITILMAVLVVVGRLLAPILDKHRVDFERFASHALSMPVSIGKVEASWYQYQPVIDLNAVTIFNKTTHEPVLQVKKMRVFFSLLASLWQRKPVLSGVLISGTEIHLRQTENKEWFIQGFPVIGSTHNEPYKQETKFQDMLGWIASQPRLILQNIDLRYQGLSGKNRFVTLYHLNIDNNDHHTIRGKALLHQDVPTAIHLAITWHGEPVDFEHIKANIYVYVSGLSLSQWLKNEVWHHWQIQKGIGSAKIWMNWDRGQFKKIQTSFQLYNLALLATKDGSTHLINRFSGNLGYKRDGHTSIFAGNDLLIDLPNHLWPVTSFYLRFEPDASGTVKLKTANLGYLDLQDAKTFLFSSEPWLSDAQMDVLKALKLSGHIQNVAVTLIGPATDLSSISFNTQFNQLSFKPWQAFPGVMNVSGALKWNGKQGDLTLDSHRPVSLHYDAFFTKPITFDRLSGQVKWQVDNQHAWTLDTASLQLANQDLTIKTKGHVSILPGAPMNADLSAAFDIKNIAHVSRYLPMRLFDISLAAWLKDAFVDGAITSGQLTLRGALNQFPFDQGNGQFSVIGTLDHVDLNYAEDWPMLQQMCGALSFKGRQLAIELSQAKMLDIPFTHVYGLIPYLGTDKSPVLTVDSKDIKADFSQGIAFLKTSPLESTIGKMFADIAMRGPIILQLGLRVPLSHPANTTVQGDLAMQDAEMDMQSWGLLVNHLNGKLHFTENGTDAHDIHAQLFDQPLKLNLSTIQKPNTSSIIEAAFTTQLNAAELEKWLKVPFSKVVQGMTKIDGVIDIADKSPMNIHLTSNLVGVSMNLPKPYGKDVNEARPLSADLIIQENLPLRLKLAYENKLGAAMILKRQSGEFNLESANLQLGSGTLAWPDGAGLYIHGNFDELNWDEIKSYASQSGDDHPSHLKLRGVDLNAKKVLISGQEMTQAELKATPYEDHWDVSIDSNEVTGKIELPLSFTPSHTVIAQFEKLALRSPEAKDSTTLKPQTLPTISFFADNFSYNAIRLGEVSLETTSSQNKLEIRQLRLVSPRMHFQAMGDWTAKNTTHLRGVATSQHMSDFLNSLGFDVHNFIANNSRIDFNLSWNGAPYSPDLSQLSGTANVSVGVGRIANVGQETQSKMDIARMLSIFGLQTIPRRLSLNFSDIYQKGYSFDSIRGNFIFKNGDAYTNNLRIEGPVAGVSISGRIGLKNKDCDITMSVTPYVTPTLPIPIAATVLSAGNPLIGIVALGVSTVISNSVAKVTTYSYEVTGPWGNPTWKSISHHQRNQ